MIWILYKNMLMLFSAVLLNFILGTIIYIIWKLLGRLAESKGYVEINYWIWKIVLLAFLCPVGIIVLFGIKKKGLYGFDFWYANKIRILLTVLGIVWFIGSVIRAFIYMKKMHQMHKMLQKGRKCQPEIIKKKQQICCELGQKNNIDIVKHKEIKIPMAYGIFHRRIVLPEIEYSTEEIDIILHHELIHHKHHDLLWKAIFMMVHITYWFHPGMKDLIRQLDQWGEAYCDRTASYYIESMKTYFNVIIDIATEEKECNTYCMGLCENSELLVLRMKRMQSYLNKKPLKRITAVSLMLIIFGISSITVAASTIGFAKGYAYVADQTMDEESVIETEKVIDYKIDRKEKIRSQKREGIEVIKQGAIIPDVNDAGILDLKLKAKERIETKKKYIDKKKGKEIEISVSTGLEEDHVSKKIAIGIIEPNGKERYIEEGRNLWHGFKINKSGDYVIFIENYGEKDVDISGYCSVNPYITKEEDKKFEESNN